MRTASKWCSCSVVSGLLVCAPIAGATVGDLYVNSNHTGPFEGTETNPFLRIRDALTSPPGSGDVIHVASGTYNAALGEVFPIELPNGVTLEGPSTGSLPLIGGDLIDEAVSATALVEVDATTSDVVGVAIRRLKFLGEDETGMDSPIALRVVVANGYRVEGLVFEDNECSRPLMNESGSNGKATIHVEVANGDIKSNCRISDNDIVCSPRGGVEVIGEAGTGEILLTRLAVDDNTFTLPAGAASLFAIRWHALDAGASDETADGFRGLSSVSGNEIVPRGALNAGIEILCDEHTSFGIVAMSENVIDDCSGHGVVLSADGWGTVGLPEILIQLQRSRVINNGGSGVISIWDRTGYATTSGSGYIHVLMDNSLIANNQRYGAEFIGLDENSQGSLTATSSTIVYNELGAEGFDDHDPEDQTPVSELGVFSASHALCVVWGNNDNGDQVIGLTSGLLAGLHADVQYSDWKGVPLDSPSPPCSLNADSQHNIDCDPEFVNVDRKNYHLDDGSPCIDIGLNSLAATLDIDGQPRTQDGDFACSGVPEEIVDLGCDEVPEPDCP